MKILYYSPHPALNLQSPSGYGTHMREMIEAFRLLGHEVLPVIEGGTETQPLVQDLPAPGTLKRLLRKLTPDLLWETLKDLRILRQDKMARQRLDAAIQKFRPDLIYERCAYLQTSGVEAAKAAGIPHLLEVNAPLTEERFSLGKASLLKWKARRTEQMQLMMTSGVVVVSSILRDHFMTLTGLPESRFILAPNSIDPAKISVEEERVQQLRKQLGIEGKFVFGFVGSIFPWHGVDRLIRAFHAFADEKSDVRLLIVGSGYVMDDLKALTRELQEESRIHFTGNIPHADVFPHIALMDVCVLPNSHWYGSPVKLFEYGAMGKAIIAIGNAPVKETLTDGEEGILIGTDESSLRAAIQKMYAEPEFRKRTGDAFRKKVLTHYTWKLTAARILQHVSALKKKV